LTSKSPDSSPTPTPSGPASEAQKPNTIVILQPLNLIDIRLIANDISTGMLSCAIVCMDGLNVADQRLAMEPVFTACIDRHLITAPTGTALVIGPDIEVRVRQSINNSVYAQPISSVSAFERIQSSSSPLEMKSVRGLDYIESKNLGPTEAEALKFLFPEKSDAEITSVMARVDRHD
jgi:hypothetical protein